MSHLLCGLHVHKFTMVHTISKLQVHDRGNEDFQCIIFHSKSMYRICYSLLVLKVKWVEAFTTIYMGVHE